MQFCQILLPIKASKIIFKKVFPLLAPNLLMKFTPGQQKGLILFAVALAREPR
jgi:hypothetical protein